MKSNYTGESKINRSLATFEKIVELNGYKKKS